MTHDLPHSGDPVALATDRQRRAANPDCSAWVDASAGSGKTRVLTDRVLRLLLRDVPAHRILCLTYTKAAAANMANRLAKELGAWARMQEADLTVALRTLTGEPPEPETLTRARQLFARVLDVPGGLQFLTIHGFCQSLLARFPLEAGVPVGFTVLEERTSQKLLADAARQVIATASPAVTHLLATFDPSAFRKQIAAIVQARGQLARVLDHHGSVEQATEAVRVRLGVDRLPDLRARIPVDAMRRAVDLLTQGAKTDQKLADQWAMFLANPQAGMMSLADSVLTKERTPRARLPTKKLADAHPDLVTLIREVQEIGLAVVEQEAVLCTMETTAALLAVSGDLLTRYRALKERAVALDFDDLIEHAQNLLHSVGAPWVLYKLDGGISHVLVDEAQDTNAAQWQILDSLTGEFFAGDTARNAGVPPRTVFAVGDYKQSIFGFQGADPESFRQARDTVRTRVRGADQHFEEQIFNTSFRSAQGVLDVLNRIFADPDAARGLGDAFPLHRAAKTLPGQVELWPLAVSERATDDTPWPLPETTGAFLSPRRRVAERLAQRLHQMKQDGLAHEGDMLVLVRSRTGFVAELMRACKACGLAVAGADRMQLTDQLAVEDVLAVLAVLLQPEDDLTLATVLKGPFVGLDEDQLFALAQGRAGSLWARVQAREPILTAWLYALMNRADSVTPYALIAGLLAQPCPADAHSGRRAVLGRLGPEAADPLDELLAVTLAYEETETPTLQGFLAWLPASDTQIKREMEQAGRAIRIMTVHGAKGLEAPVVVLADAESQPKSPTSPLLFDRDDPCAPPLLAPNTAGEAAPARARRAALQDRTEAEYRRLLYVALTRAERILIVAGWNGRKKEKPGEKDAEKAKGPETRSWYQMVEQGLRALPGTDTIPFDAPGAWLGDALCFRSGGSQEAVASRAAPSVVTLPRWIPTPPPPEPIPCRPLSPSRPETDEADDPVLSPLDGGTAQAPYRRGLLIHRLLQTLPTVPPESRRAAGLRWLRAQGETSAGAEFLLAAALGVVEHPDFGPIFGPDSQAEVAITGMTGDRIVNGRLDRLAVTADTVWLVDFKTNRQPPASLAEVPPSHLRQLTTYRALLASLYPAHRLRSFLLWTTGPTLMEVAPVSSLPHE